MVTTNLKKKKQNKEFPYSERYCINCNKETLFKYDRIIGHSSCEECGYFGPTNKKWKGLIVAEKRV